MRRGVFRRLALAAVGLASALAVSCGDGDGDGETVTPVPTGSAALEANAVEIFLQEAQKIGWFNEGDEIEVTSTPMLIAEAQTEAQRLQLPLYATLPGPGPYPEGLPGYFITAEGQFYDVADGETPRPETGRRPALAIAFVDTQGRLTYSRRFTDMPSPTADPSAGETEAAGEG
jgi:hypothetical protein